MTKRIPLLILVTTVLTANIAAADQKARATQARGEIEKALGFVPAFIKTFPDALLPGFWDELQSVEMNPKTELDNRTKELIGLAVAAQVPCEYCIYFHTRAAKANGATDEQVAEALAVASMTREASTILNGSQLDLAQFKRDVDRIFSAKK